MGEVVPARTSPTQHPSSPPTVHQLSRLALLRVQIVPFNVRFDWCCYMRCVCMYIYGMDITAHHTPLKTIGYLTLKSASHDN